MFFNELKNKLHTKQAYSAITGLSAEGVRKRLKSVKAPQTYNLGGVVFVECEVQPKVEVEKFVKVMPTDYKKALLKLKEEAANNANAREARHG